MTRGSRLTSEDLEEIRERAEKATEGPWEAIKFNYIRPVNGFMSDDLIGEATENEDADFIANAREDIPKLLAEIERLRFGLNVICENKDNHSATMLETIADYTLYGDEEEDE